AVPLKVTVLLPCTVPKFVPVMVTGVPAGPDVGDKLKMPGPTVTVKIPPLIDWAFSVRVRLPVVAPLRTGTTIEVVLQLVGVAATPLNVTVLDPWVAPKFAPVIVTDVPTGPEVGDRVVIEGGGITVNETPLLACPFTVATTLPVVVPVGTDTTIEVA